MRVTCVGGAGYVGSACARALAAAGHEVQVIDNLSTGTAAAVPACDVVEADVRDADRLEGAIRSFRPDTIMHFAALASVPESFKNPDEYWHVNVVGTRNLLNAAASVKARRFIFSSTAATYDLNAQMPLDEDSPRNPATPYGASKLAAELMIRDYAKASGMGVGVLRYFNAAGADEGGAFGEARTNETHLIPLVLSVVLGQREKVTIFGSEWPTPDGTCVRDYVHVSDIAAAHIVLAAALRDGEQRTYNVGTGTGTSVIEVIQACERTTGKAIARAIAPPRPGDPAVLVASSDRLRSDLGWRPRMPDIDAIVASAWRWHRTHPGGY